MTNWPTWSQNMKSRCQLKNGRRISVAILATAATAIAINPAISAQELDTIDNLVLELNNTLSEIHVVEFAPVNLERDLIFLGRYFFGESLTKEMAEVDTDRYLYFNSGYSKLWYYPASGAFEWVRTDPPVALNIELNDEAILALNMQAMNVINTLRRNTPHPEETLEFAKVSKVTVHSGQLDTGDTPARTWLRRVEVKFQQKLSSIPNYAGHRVSVSFCGDMAICRIKMHLRPIVQINTVEPVPVPELQSRIRSSFSEEDGPYYVDHIDSEKAPRIGYNVYSKSYSQKAAVPHIMVPVCLSQGGYHSSGCEVRSIVATPLVDEAETLVMAHRVETKRNVKSELILLKRPPICDQFPDRKECAP